MSSLLGFAAMFAAWATSTGLKEELPKGRARLISLGLVALAAAVAFAAIYFAFGGLLLTVARLLVLFAFWTGMFTFVRSFFAGSADSSVATRPAGSDEPA